MGVNNPAVVVQHEQPPVKRRWAWLPGSLDRASVARLEKHNERLMARKAEIIERQRRVNALITEKKKHG